MGRTIVRYGGKFLLLSLLAAVLIAASSGVDRLMHHDRVGRNVTLAGYVVADGDAMDIARVINAEDEAAASLPVTIRTEGLVIETTVADSGVSIDEQAVTDAALTARNGDGIVDGFRQWIRSLRSTVEVPLQYELDADRLRALIEEHPGRVLRHPQEPAFSGEGGAFQVVEAVAGSYLNADDVIAALAAEVASGPPPYTVDVAPTPIPTQHSATDLDAALAQVDDLATRMTVTVNDRVGIISPRSVRSWIDSAVIGGELVPTFASDRVQSALESWYVSYAEPLPQPQFSVDEGQVHVDLGVPARGCCAAGVDALLFDAAVANDTAAAIELPTVRVEDDGGQARADAFGINEMVYSFTTRHACCQNRVRNIQRIADLVRGYIIEPGETLSINDFIGRRTRANGFVADGAIQSGHVTDQVGGGISQFATTTFNAAFFAGLDIDEYQSHSIYISRYPYGREATLSFPLPDLEVTNNTPYAAMIWTGYTSRSITVEVWSTPYFDVEQTRQTSYKIGRCTRVNTYRERTAPDGTVIEDFFIATYRPGEGLDCNGNPTPEPP